MIRKVAVVGPESTGKSTLCQQLAHHFDTAFVPEVARKYLGNLGRPYTRTDVETIARLQLEEEDIKCREARAVLFCDTTLLVIKIWMIHAYGSCPDWILNSLQTRHYDLHLLTDIDLPWTPDPLREHPEKREFFRNWYKKELVSGKVAWSWVRGDSGERLQSALTSIKNHIEKWPGQGL